MTLNSIAVALAGISFMLTVIWGQPLIRVLRYFKVGKAIRVEGPERHFTKAGTPTMGGVMMILPVTMITLMMNASRLMGIQGIGLSVLLPLGTMFAYGMVGAVDDWVGLRGERKAKGLSARAKLAFQLGIGVVIALILRYVLDAPYMFIPGVPADLPLGIWYIPVAVIIITGMSNFVNLTDGLDGLAGLISATAFAAYGGIAMLQGQAYLARFCFTLVGAIFGFLWFNVHPAQLFMGDTGSLPLGAALGVVALMTGQWLLLPVIAIIPCSIGMSVILQVGYFKWTRGRRLFKMAPLQHHFELSGWSETQIVQRFWLISLLFAMIGMALASV